ncbi:MAG: hypothetical protein NTZ49_01230 [Candidatus Parcubacteria bacterium]|nr:hypothetical protein [Candidatus Parcubacteria bacterium]
MEKLKSFLLVGVLVGIILLIPYETYALNEESPKMSQESLTCQNDKDCILVENQCGFTDAINRNYLKTWEYAVSITPKDMLCGWITKAWLTTEHEVARCRNNSCTVVTELEWWAKNSITRNAVFFYHHLKQGKVDYSALIFPAMLIVLLILIGILIFKKRKKV